MRVAISVDPNDENIWNLMDEMKLDDAARKTLIKNLKSLEVILTVTVSGDVWVSREQEREP